MIEVERAARGITHVLLRGNRTITYIDEITYSGGSDAVDSDEPTIRAFDVEIDDELVQQRVDECVAFVEQYGAPCDPCSALEVGDERTGSEFSCTP